jgi:hypothetical protein
MKSRIGRHFGFGFRSLAILLTILSPNQRVPEMRRHPLYSVWRNMISRCENSKNRKYPDYGGRGIKVCARWRECGNRWRGTPGFDAFVRDMRPRPSSGHTLERENVNGDYEPMNCLWATQKQQQRNRRDNHILTFRGRSLSLSAWADETGLNRSTIKSRIVLYGWSVSRALTTAVRG